MAIPDTVFQLDAFYEELRRLGWSDTDNADIVVANARGDTASLPAVVTELVARAPDVIISSSNRTHIALRDVTTTIPIVTVAAIDPVRIGLSESLARPSRNFTGNLGFVEDLMAKRLELLREVLPNARRVALHLDPTNPAFPPTRDEADKAASVLGFEVMIAGYLQSADVLPALDLAQSQAADAIIVVPDALAIPHIRAIGARADEMRIPTLGLLETDLEMGLTFVMGVDRRDQWRTAAQMADRILRGEKLVNLPFQRPTKVHMGINLQKARQLGIQVPTNVLARAEEVID